MFDDLKHKVVLVLGSSSGIGEATAILFATYGCKLVVHGRNQQRIARVASKCASISPFGYKPLEVAADLRNLEEVRKLAKQTIDHYGQLDIFVNNVAFKDTPAGILDEGVLKCMETMCFDKLRANVLLSHLLLPYLIETKGTMIILSSVCAIHPCFDKGKLLNFYMTDAALDMLSKTLASEFGEKGVRVNTVNPYVVNTPANYDLFPNESEAIKFMEEEAQKSALKKLIQPEDVAKSIVFLSSDASNFVTGHSLVIDGGLLYH
ncbi:3-oxoacyl-[acyl-carrier-protein] reductase FabG-like protein, partial [Dinothrombium tinctorium]|uniref:3-oxoacyl-[acyl-carrier-protein] reductase FabG-like protein n=1 Tax=Dinothrombium tinctorium TaxID=1965070 RepID=A0A3S3NE15_9ACAR